MTSDHAPTSGRPAEPRSLPRQADQSGRATPYRTTLTTQLPFDDVLSLVDETLAAWLKQEGHDEPPPADGSPRAERLRLGERVLLDRDTGPLPGSAEAPAAPSPATASDAATTSATSSALPTATAAAAATVTGHYARRRLRTPDGAHRTHLLTITVAATAGGAATTGDGPGVHGPVVVRLEAEHLTSGPPVRSPGRVPVPEVARILLPLLDAHDGPAPLTAQPRVVTPAEVDDLIDQLCDPERRLAAVVVSVPPSTPLEEWLADQVQPVLHQLTGLASLHVLDHAALPLFNVAFEFHKVYGGAVRTYLPEVDPASRADAGRHQVLATRRMTEDTRRAAGLLAREPRQIAAAVPQPSALAAVPPLVVPPEHRQPVRSRTAPPEAPRPRADERRRRPVQRPARSGSRLCVVPAAPFAAPDEPAARSAAALRAPAEAAFARLARDVTADKEVVPESFGELVCRFTEFPLLQFTGDEKETVALDGQPDGSGWARLAWDGLTALQEYAAAAVRGEAGGDFKAWCEHTPPGCHHFPPRKAVRWESRTVESHAKWKRERMLPVPPCVDASRRAFMGAHLRIGGGSTAPRLHYLDDCSGSGRIYVGYIGQHLTNTRTN
ncbi:hypothetical protein [Streptomyces sp. NRRL B-24484]|uniref:hypothetical protein n=1 Tax=Streptomyces sp. NRRL B-24484 TaxID=1463833 RepID=UPI0004C1C26A|nr:hypothetical protein [Streptomyces sp. NRRL B-24484]